MPLPYGENITEAIAYRGRLAPVSQSTGTVTVGPVQLGQAKKVLFAIDVGSVGAAGTVDAKIQASATSGGTYADVTGGAITQVTATGVVFVEVKAETLSNLGVGPWVRLSITVGTNAVVLEVMIFAAPTDYSPASLLNGTVLQTLVV